ncbi:MAG: cytochrome c oxidase assembly protein [Proteobacteria bacterium]|nr:cytochrome c oxidase assembly protein [Pseudomonadota bacterium]
MTDQNRQKANRRTITRLFVVAGIMFGFGYALVPLYDLICDVTGLNGKTGRTSLEQFANVNDGRRDGIQREVTVEFTTHASSGLPWEFRPLKNKMKVKLGVPTVALFYARNTSAETITGQAIPSVAPNRAAPHFKKTECFCFSKQTLKAGEAKEMPVQFVINPKLSKEVDTITLAYAFFNADKDSAKKYGGTPGEEPANQNAHAHHAGHDGEHDHKL